MYRTENGDPIAIGNMCPHRFAPLDRGKLIGDHVQCGYHGIRFGPDGRCVLNPHIPPVKPQTMRVPCYPLAERYGLVWVWIGKPELADASLIPNFACHDDPGFRRIHGVFELKAHYELVTDNLLDLSHAEFLHEGVLSSDAITASKLEIAQAGSTLWANRWCPNGAITPAWAAAYGGWDAPVDQWLYMRWDPPATMLFDVGFTRVGHNRSEGIWMYGTDILTPVHRTTTRYFWAFCRNYRTTDPTVDDFWRASIRVAFEEQDKPMIEAQQQMMGDRRLDELKPVIIAGDGAATRARGMLKKLMDAQDTWAPSRPAGKPLQELLRDGAATRMPVAPVV